MTWWEYHKKRQKFSQGLVSSTSTLVFNNASKVDKMTTSGIQEISRFHAIVAAKPLHGIGPPVIERHIPHEPWSVRFHTGKRKRETPGVVSMANKAVKRNHEGNSTREVSTKSSEQLISYWDFYRRAYKILSRPRGTIALSEKLFQPRTRCWFPRNLWIVWFWHHTQATNTNRYTWDLENHRLPLYVCYYPLITMYLVLTAFQCKRPSSGHQWT